ncbi:DUF397 domain-containing protein [Actinomadura atramentaria]|uniref:DUF397 domain-containing protein n=1 Tax=Actinomadura atramentaria TaxID=1990 RepID=UPI0003A94BF9|nr:DUF397 domain-containing protein [Actinomadura atramentaria]
MELHSVTSWRKSSYSGGTGECVEVATALTSAAWTAVRDSKDPHGPILVMDSSVWAIIAGEIKVGGYDL